MIFKRSPEQQNYYNLYQDTIYQRILNRANSEKFIAIACTKTLL
ncbi:hypothetical protein [Okeania sp. SIO3B5]|nr:hypothetical protein [Okeania sp. SIO3B5]